ncbi:hypothetical protein PR048_008067 [Dryococelus australis]|uniref:Uncharacterized protein n=1 Tax=Dryococelus australis TaxID=614101 RepID=A0ABQ9HWV0_9NEOP|nr:hypothetical protein PR048_008067 [Dryococelus australis]
MSRYWSSRRAAALRRREITARVSSRPIQFRACPRSNDLPAAIGNFPPARHWGGGGDDFRSELSAARVSPIASNGANWIGERVIRRAAVCPPALTLWREPGSSVRGVNVAGAGWSADPPPSAGPGSDVRTSNPLAHVTDDFLALVSRSFGSASGSCFEKLRLRFPDFSSASEQITPSEGKHVSAIAQHVIRALRRGRFWWKGRGVADTARGGKGRGGNQYIELQPATLCRPTA